MRLTSYPWPGNVRQLLNVVQNMVVTAFSEERRPGETPVLDVRHIPADIRSGDEAEGALPDSGEAGSLAGTTLEQIEKRAIRETLRLTAGNREQAAKLLGIGERTLYRKLRNTACAERRSSIRQTTRSLRPPPCARDHPLQPTESRLSSPHPIPAAAPPDATTVTLTGQAGVNVEAEVAVSGTGRPVVFLHGLVGLNDHWEDVSRSVSRTARCVMVEFPLLELTGDDCSIME